MIWTAEFASQKWLYDMTPYVEKAKDKYIAAPLETVHYGGKYWGAPASSDAAFIFYRTDKGGGAPPATWQEVYAEAKAQGGLVYQGAPYEGLTCDYLELAFAAGGKVLSDDGKKSEINSPRERQGAAADGRRHQGRRGAEGRDDLHGAGDRPGVDQRPVRLHAQLDLRLRARDNKRPTQGRGQVQGRAAADLRGRAARPASSAATTA